MDDRITDAARSKWERFDGWRNNATGIGVLSVDKRESAQFAPRPALPESLLTALFCEDTLAWIAVALFPEEALRLGFAFGAVDSPEVGEQTAPMITPRFLSQFTLACEMGRLHGGALLIPRTEGAGAMEELPVEGEPVVDWMVVERSQIYQVVTSIWGEPIAYQFQTDSGGTISVHAARCIRFGGVLTPSTERRKMQGWDHSVLHRPYETIRDFGMSFAGISSCLATPSTTVYSIKDLRKVVGQGGSAQEKISSKVAVAEIQRSTARAVTIDSEDSMQLLTQTFTGLPDTVDRLLYKVASDLRIPVSILFGRSPAGMNSTGESDFRAFYDAVASYRTQRLDPALLAACKLWAIGQGLELPPTLSVIWPPLWQPTEAEQATTYATRAGADSTYLSMGVLGPGEVRSRFEGEDPYGGITLDSDLDTDELAAEALDTPGDAPA